MWSNTVVHIENQGKKFQVVKFIVYIDCIQGILRACVAISYLDLLAVPYTCEKPCVFKVAKTKAAML